MRGVSRLVYIGSIKLRRVFRTLLVGIYAISSAHQHLFSDDAVVAVRGGVAVDMVAEPLNGTVCCYSVLRLCSVSSWKPVILSMFGGGRVNVVGGRAGNLH